MIKRKMNLDQVIININQFEGFNVMHLQPAQAWWLALHRPVRQPIQKAAENYLDELDFNTRKKRLDERSRVIFS